MGCGRLASFGAALVIACGSNADPSALGRNGTNAGTGTPGSSASPPGKAFSYDAELSLLPFDVRLAKVARVVGVEPDDALLEPLRAKRYDLGDHDYSKGVKPDSTWSSTRIGTWVKALKPICGSRQMHARYSALPAKLGDLILVAYGREVTDEDRKSVEEGVATTELDNESRFQVVCLSVLSSLEFVAR